METIFLIDYFGKYNSYNIRTCPRKKWIKVYSAYRARIKATPSKISCSKEVICKIVTKTAHKYGTDD
tara:strand:+ start:264 stop:464 length:201 start_codon:yes stop_codon:yes gene_type:complete